MNFDLTAPEPNAIVLENQKPGNPQSEWDITGAGSSNIEGFATDISINRGNRVDFKINTDSNNYRIDIYRLGYYGGMGARKVATLQHTGVQTQPTPLRDSTTGLVDAGNWAVTASWDIPADAVSGIYTAKLVRQDGTAGQNHIPFIVRDDSSSSDVIFQTADTTWQAYNHWGGANLYQGNGPGGDTSPGRAYKVSYNRPIITRGGGLAAGPQDYIFSVEFPALMWLEKNGYDVSYMSGVDVDRFGNLLKNHKMYLSVGHDEYWSGQQRANVEAARDAGVNLAFWSGNEAYWKTRWEPSISTGSQDYRTLVSYKETRAGPIDPSNEWTGTWRDPRFVGPNSVGAGQPENSLTGTMFQVDSYRLDAITVPYDDANLRFWRNTSVADLQPGQTATLTKNYLGYEWDAAPDNGFDPAGLVKLSSTTLPVDKYLRDYGTRTGAGTAEHNLTLYRAPSGALVFGAGTVYWAWGLDSNHDLEATPVDPRVKQAMVNLLADMGIEPGTLEPGLVAATQSTDTTKPVSTITNPSAGSALTVGQAVTISGTASDSGGGVVAGVEITTDSGATWHPVTGDENWTYSWVPHTAGTFTIRTRAVDDSVNVEVPKAGQTVTVTGNNLFTASASPPSVAQLDRNPIEVGMKFQSSVAGTVTGVRFFKNDLNVGTHTGTLWSGTGTKLASATFTNETGNGWQAVSFSSPVAITPNTTYVVSYHTGGYYSSTTNGFASSVTNGPLSAPANAGVYAYGLTSTFPTSVFKAENYWVDVLFNPSTVNQQPVAVNDSGFTTTANRAITIAASALLGNDNDPDGDTLSISGVSGATNGSVTYNTTSREVTFTPNADYTGTAGFNYAISDGRGGAASASVSLSVNAPAPVNQQPVAVNDSGFTTTANRAITIAASALLGNDNDPDGDTLSISGVSGATNGSVTYNTTSREVTFTPNADYTGTAGFNYAISDGRGGAASASVSLSVNAPGSAVSLFSSSATPASPSVADKSAELGMKFQATSAGTVSGIRFYKATNETGTHTGTLWTSTGTNLGSVTFANETASGWQTATFANPIAINANTTYVVSYHSNSRYASTSNFFTADVTNGPLKGLADTTASRNGVYAYGTSSLFPTNSYQKSNYWVDVLFNPSTVNQQPVAVNDSGFTTTANRAITIAASALLGNDNDPDGDTLSISGVSGATNGSVTYNTTSREVTFTPNADYTGTAGFNYAISDGRGGAASASVSLSVNAPGSAVSLFSSSATPASPSVADKSAELGMKFQATSAGTVSGIRFYKATNETGTHTGTLWTSTGTNLGSVTFANETASGWQTATFANPIAINANTTYVVSYHSNSRYASTSNFFTADVTNGPLKGLADTTASRNGVYAYGTSSLFPTNSYQKSNYWVDVLFNPSAAA
ncbi:hypothetical protein BB934_28320 (plasmid) [Microvirga ossetica]|uniref:Mo-co oxidoreductase dimerization domain protein n=1 Tax=Microvirga ossetica TaxID=1882682 RepID=A0A1B2EQY7_9HYPH|nr:DUF4082 domain-containing protein [Microvirga ossetica]ANY82242.1 hypothetical protein BB934_28320 [Microvirga ossetica]